MASRTNPHLRMTLLNFVMSTFQQIATLQRRLGHNAASSSSPAAAAPAASAVTSAASTHTGLFVFPERMITLDPDVNNELVHELPASLLNHHNHGDGDGADADADAGNSNSDISTSLRSIRVTPLRSIITLRDEAIMMNLVDKRRKRFFAEKSVLDHLPFGIMETCFYPNWASGRTWMNKHMIDMSETSSVVGHDQTVSNDMMITILQPPMTNAASQAMSHVAHCLANRISSSTVYRLTATSTGKLIATMRTCVFRYGIGNQIYWCTLLVQKLPIQPSDPLAWSKLTSVSHAGDIEQRRNQDTTWTPPSHRYPNVMHHLVQHAHITQNPKYAHCITPQPNYAQSDS
jgi:hypothetical protein